MDFSAGWMWLVFIILVLGLLGLDLLVFNRRSHEIRIKEALLWSVFWIIVALAFNAGVFFFGGKERGVNFLTGYLIERALSMDNIFVFLLIFQYFRVPAKYQHGVLFWGILGALVMRAIFIAAGVSLIHAFHWTIYIFGAFLVFVGMKMIFHKQEKINLENNFALKLVRKLFPVTEEYHQQKFFIRKEKVIWVTPLFVVLFMIEFSDLVFAVDSIPAILAVTTDPFVVYTSNIFAILGLRASYFALAALTDLFKFLNYGLSFILVFVGVKMVITDIYKIPVGWTLGVVIFVLLVSIFASVLFPKKEKAA